MKPFLLSMLIILTFNVHAQEITPYKFTDHDQQMPHYNIPASARFRVKRPGENNPDIIYYFSRSTKENYPIALLCGGSSTKDTICSIIHFHRYFLQELHELGVGVLTIEQWGVDGQNIDQEAYCKNYTRSQRLRDHIRVLDHVIINRPLGWNGTFIFIGVSEGGPLVTSLTTHYAPITLATINWSGAGDWPWREELWVFIEDLRKQFSWWIRLLDLIPKWLIPTVFYLPKTRQEYNMLMDEIVVTPAPDKEFMQMTYQYHFDAMTTYPKHQYHLIQSPFLVVAGAQDSIIHSSDAFVEQAKKAGVNVTYMRIHDMDHYIRARPDIIVQSFTWLAEQLSHDLKMANHLQTELHL